MDYIGLFEKYLGTGKRAGNEIAFYCFRCEPKKSGERHLYMNPMTGMYCCYKCMHNTDGTGKGSAMHFAHIMGETSNFNYVGSKCKYNEEENTFNQVIATTVYTYLRDNLKLLPEQKELITRDRGISNPEAFGIRSCDGAAILLRERFTDAELLAAGLFFKSGKYLLPHSCIYSERIFIPYVSRATGDVTFIRTRAGSDSDGTLKYMSPKDSHAAKRIWGYIPSEADVLVVTEGELKAIASVEAQVLAASLPGMALSHRTLIEILKTRRIKRIIVCFDNQISGEEVDTCAIALCKKILREIDWCTTYKATLPLEQETCGGQKMDIDSYLHRHTPREYVNVLTASQKITI